MIKNVTINGKPLSIWGASLLSGTIEALLTPAPMKDYIGNESRLEHGERMLTIAKVASRELQIPFFIIGSSPDDYLNKYLSFVDELYKGTIALNIPELGKTYNLLYISSGKYGSYGSCRAKIVVKFKEPVPHANK